MQRKEKAYARKKAAIEAESERHKIVKQKQVYP